MAQSEDFEARRARIVEERLRAYQVFVAVCTLGMLGCLFYFFQYLATNC
jgi:hypothetical protein